MNPRNIFPLLIMFSAAACAFAGNRSNFLSHGPSVSAYGRGDAATAYIDEPGASYYNPSLLANMRRAGASFSHFILYDGSYYDFAGVSYPLSGGDAALSASVIRLASGDIELRRQLTDSPELTRAAQTALMISAARRIKNLYDTNLGLTLKYLYFDMYNKTGSGAGIDIGLSRQFSGPELWKNKSRIDTGIAVQNIIPPAFKLNTDEESYAAVYKFGAAINITTVLRALSSDSLTAAIDFALEDNTLSYFSGLQYEFFSKYSLRAGAYKGHYTLGAGCRYGAVKADYAFDMGAYAGFHRIGISYYWQVLADDRKLSKRKAKDRSLFMEEAQEALEESEKQRNERGREIALLFKDAKNSYDAKNYLMATDKFSGIMLKYPECESAKELYEKITDSMNEAARNTSISNYEDLSYAKGYINYRNNDFVNAINEWDKVLQFNPSRNELIEYMKKTKDYLKDMARQEKEKETEKLVQSVFDEGSAEYEKKNWIGCIKKMETVQEICKTEPFQKSLEWSDKAQSYITKSVNELAKTVIERKNKKHKETEKEPETEVDTSGADRKYKEGLVLYAQGKLSDAANAWEIAVRLNPGHEKAWKALKKVKEDLDIK